jgi:hypothetical protein
LAEYSFKGHIGEWVDVFAHDIVFATKVMILLDIPSFLRRIFSNKLELYLHVLQTMVTEDNSQKRAKNILSFKNNPYFCKRICALETHRKRASYMDTHLIQTLRNYFASSPVIKAWIFGSYSRGTQNAESDIDIMVTLDESRPVGMKFFSMYVELKELLGKEVDLVTEDSLLPWVKDSINKDKQLIYERAN